MQSLSVLIVLLSLWQGCVYTQPLISMSEIPNSPQAQSSEATSVGATSDRSNGVGQCYTA